MKIMQKIIYKFEKFLIKPKLHKKGNIFIEKITKQLNQNDIVIFVVWHFGDMILGMIYLEEILNQYHDKNILIVYEKEVIREWYGRFSNYVEFIKYNDFLNKYNVSNEECVGYITTSKCNIKGIQYNLFNTLTCFNNECKKGKNKTIIYNLQKNVFNLPINSKFTVPKPLKPTNFKYNIDKNDIIINPYSDSLRGKSIKIYQEIANLCIQMGFDVYTNVLPGQSELKGTKRLDCGLNELYYLSQEAKCFISVRSGVLDFLSFSDAHIVAIYNRTKKEFYDLYTLSQYKKDNLDEVYLKRLSFKNRDFVLNKVKKHLLNYGEQND